MPTSHEEYFALLRSVIIFGPVAAALLSLIFRAAK